MTHQRTRIRNHVAAHPGIHFNELTRQLDLAPGQVQYHLKRLLSAQKLVEHQLYGRTHYFAPAYDEWEQGALALLRRETARDIVVCLLDRERATPGDVVDELDIARSTLEWHLDHLTAQGVVKKERDSHNRVTLTLERPVETAELLQVISPALPDRLVDRFTRLFDRLLDE